MLTRTTSKLMLMTLLLLQGKSCQKIGPGVPATVPSAPRYGCCKKTNELFNQGFVRINSTTSVTLPDCPLVDPAQPTVCVYERYDDKQTGDPLKICIDSSVPTGWQDKGPYFDHYGCDPSKYEGTGLPNEKLIVKVE